MRPAAHFATPKYRRNRAFEANRRPPPNSALNRLDIHALAPLEHNRHSLMMAEPARRFAGRRNRKPSSETESMNREYHKCRSSRLGREMELLVFGHAGLPVLVFPTSGGPFYEFEDRGMIAALADKIDAGSLQFFCVDSVNDESWYNRRAHPRQRIARHMQYEEYLLHETNPAYPPTEPRPSPDGPRIELRWLPRGQSRPAPS